MESVKLNEAPPSADWTARLETAVQTRRNAGPAAALPLFESLNREAPDRAAGWIETAACLRDLQRPERAEAILTDCLRDHPTDGRAMNDLARLCERRGAWADAEALWRRLLALPNHAWWAHATLARALQIQGRMAEAEHVLKAAMTRYPDEPALHCDFARLAEMAADWTVATARWTDAHARFPAQSAPRLGLAAALRQQGDLAGAERLLRAASDADPGDIKTRHELARTLEQRGDWPGAASTWRDFREDDRASADVHSALAAALIRQGLRDEADDALEFGISRPSATLPLFLEYAKLAEQRGDWRNAAARWERVRERWPDLAAGYAGQSAALRKIGDVDAAAAIMADALRRFATDPDVRREAAAVQLQQGDWDGAGSALEKVAGQNPHDPIAAHRLYEIRRSMAGDPDRSGDRPASAPSLGHRVMATGPLGGDIEPMTLFPHAAQPHVRRAKDLEEFSSSHTLSLTFLDAAAGEYDRARRRIADTIDVNEQRYPHDASLFGDLFVAAVASCSWDAAVRMLRDRYRTDWCADIRVAREPMRAQCIRWTVAEDGRSSFEIDKEYFGGLPAWLERWPSTLDMMFQYSTLPNKSAGSIVFSLADHGILPGLAFSDFRADVFLIPDPQFTSSQGYAERRSFYDPDRFPWDRRKPVAFWRGSAMRTSGHDLSPIQGEPFDVPRIKLCAIGREPDAAHLMDVGLTGNHSFSADQYGEFEQRGLTAGFVNQRQFIDYKYQIDIDGISNSWSFFWKLLTGSPVLKVQSPTGFRQWFYDDLEPWVHFVPVSADLSDMADRIRWLRAHDDEARTIGANGRALALSMTYETEIDRAMATIAAAFQHFEGR